MLSISEKKEIFKRFIFALDLFDVEKKEDIISSLPNSESILRSIEHSTDPKNFEYLMSIYMFELEIYKMVTANYEMRKGLLDERVKKLSKTHSIIRENKMELLNQNFIVNDSNRLITSKYNWATLTELTEKNFYITIDYKTLEEYHIYIRTAIIKDILFDEIVLDFELKLLIDLLQLDESFYGYEVIDAIIEGIEDEDDISQYKQNIEAEVSNSLLLYVLYFDALKII